MIEVFSISDTHLGRVNVPVDFIFDLHRDLVPQVTDFIIWAGDMADLQLGDPVKGTNLLWKLFLLTLSLMQPGAKLVIVPGNHDWELKKWAAVSKDFSDKVLIFDGPTLLAPQFAVGHGDESDKHHNKFFAFLRKVGFSGSKTVAKFGKWYDTKWHKTQSKKEEDEGYRESIRDTAKKLLPHGGVYNTGHTHWPKELIWYVTYDSGDTFSILIIDLGGWSDDPSRRGWATRENGTWTLHQYPSQ